jgi:hypothetical protein
MNTENGNNSTIEIEEYLKIQKAQKYINLQKIGDAPLICLDCQLLYGVFHEEYDDIQWMCKKGTDFYPGLKPPCEQ